MAYLRVNNLCKRFITLKNKEVVPALENLHFEVCAGELFVILGPTGCGKTTLLNIIAGFARPGRGSIVIDGQRIGKPGWQRTMVFQEYALFPWLTVSKNIEFGLEMKKVEKNIRQKRVEELMELVGLKGFRDVYPRELSGGMKQRVAIARALAVEPQILLMDEPFGSLDAQTRETLQDTLMQLWLRNKTTVLFVTHNVDEAVKLGQRIMIMTKRPGRVKEIIAIRSQYPRDIIGDMELIKIKSHIHKSISEEVRASLNTPIVPLEDEWLLI